MVESLFKKNLDKLMDFYNETQAEVARAVGLNPQDITKARSRKEPSKTTLELIAYHYNLSEDELIHKDLEISDKFYLDADRNKQIDKLYKLIFPIFSTKEAKNNESFLKAYKNYKDIFKLNLNQDNLNDLGDKLLKTIRLFIGTYLNDGIPESLANACSLIVFAEFLKNNPNALNDIANQNYCDSHLQVLKKYSLNYIYEDEVEDVILRNVSNDDLCMHFDICVDEAIKINRYVDLIDYLYAIRYLYGFSYEDLTISERKMVCKELLHIQMNKNNKYAKKFIETLSKIVV